jgi:hypothetical protein
MKTFSQETRCVGRDPNRTPLGCNSEALSLESTWLFSGLLISKRNAQELSEQLLCVDSRQLPPPHYLADKEFGYILTRSSPLLAFQPTRF